MLDWQFFEDRFPLVTGSLKHAVTKGRLAHSFIISSSNPDFRLDFPILMGCLAACENRKEDGSPCEKCETCRQIKNGLYPDLYTLSPTSKSREIRVGDSDSEPDTLRSFEAAFHLSSISRSGWKIGIIHDCDTMNTSAQNAFLKTLEEPPQKTIFILATGRVASLLPTTRSRCQILSLTDNNCVYDYTHFAELPALLHKLAFESKNNIAKAEETAQGLCMILASLDKTASEKVSIKWAQRMEEAQNLESAGIKLLEKRIAGETGCEYRRMREQFISMIHSYFAQIALLSGGIDEKSLPNPELLKDYLESASRPKVVPRDAFRMLNEAESLMSSLRTNVNDELAIRSFTLNAALKR